MPDQQGGKPLSITPRYRHDPVYAVLERLCTEAGIRIVYKSIPDDSISGEIWARTDSQGQSIEMPDQDCFDCDEMASLILGHEMAHIITGLDTVDYLPERVRNEAVCDLLGSHLYSLAEMIAGAEVEAEVKKAFEEV